MTKIKYHILVLSKHLLCKWSLLASQPYLLSGKVGFLTHSTWTTTGRINQTSESGTQTPDNRLAHHHHSSLHYKQLAISGLKLVSELKPNLRVAPTYCPVCNVHYSTDLYTMQMSSINYIYLTFDQDQIAYSGSL